MNKGFLSPKSVSKDSTTMKNGPGQHVVTDSNSIMSGLKVNDPHATDAHTLANEADGHSENDGGTCVADSVRVTTSSNVKFASSDSPMNVTCDATPNQVKPVSLGDDSCEMNEPNVAQILSNARKKFDATMNDVQAEIASNKETIPNANSPSGPPPNAPKVDSTSGNGEKSVSYAGVASNESHKNVSNFRRLECSYKKDNVDLSVPMKVVEEVNMRFEHTLYGYFLGHRLAFPVVDYFVRNAWAKYGLQKVMMNAKGFFFFKFTSKKGVDDVLDNGPWLIRNVPIILKPWTLNTNLLKEDLTHIPVWVKFHDVPLAMFSDDGLSLLATLIGTPKRLDAFTSQMCKESWGRSSFARCMIEVKSDEVLRDSLTVEIPLLDGSGATIEKIRVEYEWKPPRCDKCRVFGHVLVDCPKGVIPTAQPSKNVNDGFKTVNNKKKGKQAASNTGRGGFTKPVVGKHFEYQPKKTPAVPKKVNDGKKKTSDVASTSGTTISTSNQFDALHMDDTDTFGIPTYDTCMDVDTGSSMEVNVDESVKTGATSQEPLVSDSMGTKEVGSTPLVEKISKFEKLIIDGKGTLVDDDGHPVPSASVTKRANPFSKVGNVVVSDSDEEEVLNTFNESANLFGGGHEREDEFDDYDDYSKQIYDLPGELDALNAIYGFNLQGRRK